MNISLTPELEEFVRVAVETRRYSSASEVIVEALEIWKERELQRASQLHEFHSEIDRRLASLDRGEGLDGEQLFAKLRAKAAERRR